MYVCTAAVQTFEAEWSCTLATSWSGWQHHKWKVLGLVGQPALQSTLYIQKIIYTHAHVTASLCRTRFIQHTTSKPNLHTATKSCLKLQQILHKPYVASLVSSKLDAKPEDFIFILLHGTYFEYLWCLHTSSCVRRFSCFSAPTLLPVFREPVLRNHAYSHKVQEISPEKRRFDPCPLRKEQGIEVYWSSKRHWFRFCANCCIFHIFACNLAWQSGPQ